MITGFNTDIEFDGVIYHVQTEDKGLDTPLILTLVYVGGAILASKRSPYHDLINAGFDPLVLGERLQRQHTLICAAIKAGRVEDLKRMTQRDQADPAAAPAKTPPVEKAAPVKKAKPVEKTDAAPSPPTPPPAAPAAEPPAPEIKTEARETKPKAPDFEQGGQYGGDILALDDAPAEVVPAVEVSETPQAVPVEPVRLIGKQQDEFIQVEAEDSLHLSLLEEQEFHAGEVVTIRIRVSRGGSETRVAAANVPVTVKILGTEFRPLILTTRSDRDGVATIHAWLPRFTKGRAAVLVRAALDGFSAELRRVIHQL